MKQSTQQNIRLAIRNPTKIMGECKINIIQVKTVEISYVIGAHRYLKTFCLF